MVFQKSNPFPKSIFETWPTAFESTHGLEAVRARRAVEESLKQAAIWER
jgi:ABC-type phosphate transport system ATPase subunit